ncbi:YlaI family protein [Pseudalkalibacillus salsuginis]|uniref:YlaI family protein n=1 Tax=Pseudalkalibacillus salsuginis TaxID=2910972 RepID=UPI001CD3A817|nr:YlaI family protein [Pseudalkalibacillus salsuginis]MCF6410417.1 YlaI family protein [Pseudalkalibacillus salsuginis]
MRVKCVLCDKIEKIEDQSPLAKKLRNRPIHTYMCQPCHSRIKVRTEERKTSGNFVTYRNSSKEESW